MTAKNGKETANKTKHP